MPAEQMALGKGDQAVIVFHTPALEKLSHKKLLRILAHEVGHVKHHYDALLRGEPIKHDLAEREADKLLGSTLEDLLHKGEP
jgi:hypothetical protein